MLKGSRCTWLTPGTERRIETPACLACARSGANPCGYPYPFVSLMLKDRDPAVVACSATMIPGCPREQGIKKHHDWYVAPERAYTRAFGSIVHLGAEVLGRDQLVVEWRAGRTIQLGEQLVDVTAQMDALYWDEATNIYRLQDYKVVDTLAPSKVREKSARYIAQLSIQRWILAGHNIELASAELVFLSHKGKQIINLLEEDGDEELHLWSLERTEAYLRERLPALVASLSGQLAEPLEGPASWLCNWCDVKDTCQELYGKPIPAFR